MLIHRILYKHICALQIYCIIMSIFLISLCGLFLHCSVFVANVSAEGEAGIASSVVS